MKTNKTIDLETDTIYFPPSTTFASDLDWQKTFYSMIDNSPVSLHLKRPRTYQFRPHRIDNTLNRLQDGNICYYFNLSDIQDLILILMLQPELLGQLHTRYCTNGNYWEIWLADVYDPANDYEDNDPYD